MSHAPLDQQIEFQDILLNKKISTIYQPIVSAKDSLPYGYEALTRGPVNSYFHSPVHLFPFAENEDLLFPIEKLARESALNNAFFLKRGEKLFINLSSKVINDPNFTPGHTIHLLEKLQIEPNNIVFEITERHSIDDFETFRNALNHYRNQGFKIAIDDAGAGYSSIMAISELAPDFIKIDRSLSKNIHRSEVKEKIVEAFLAIASKLNCKVVAEGIETEEELKKIVNLGVDFVQGYYLAKPSFPIESISVEASQLIKNNSYFSSKSISTLVKTVKFASIHSTSDEIQQLLLSDEKTNTLVLMENNHPKTIVKQRINGDFTFSNLFIYVDVNTQIDSIIHEILKHYPEAFPDILVTRNDKIIGIITMHELLTYCFLKNNPSIRKNN